MSPLLLLFLLLLLSSTSLQAQQKTTLGSSRTPEGPRSFWLSPSGDFTFGFRFIEGNASSYLLAIWFRKTTLVQVSSGSQLLLNSNGALSLQDSTGTEVWNPQVVGELQKTLQIPSCLLSIGVFLNTVVVPSGNLYDYYRSMAGNTTKLVFNATGMVYITLDNGTQISVTSGVTGSMLDYYHRATLDPNGVFRQYRCLKKVSNLSSQAWSVVVDFKPPNISDAQLTNDGSGICGFKSYCTFNGTNNQSICLCPEQYSFIEEETKYKAGPSKAKSEVGNRARPQK
ncbi:hypothetical protein SETIT_7G037500v2 [Setaria italica]|uniref:Bulb-type lectin domain-containing protein n=1 Tax=Setaria italica TaxID=4555 RepID=K3YDE8_SETIT|nr:hypothetical protein SETIT_7G037500v2 [Setaria italica]